MISIDCVVVDYDIVYEDSARSMTNTVNQMLSQGWVPQGGVSIAVDANSKETKYVQAMIKVEKDDRDR